MKKQMKNVTKTIWTLRSILALFCMVAALYGVSFVCHADTVKGTITVTSVNVRESASTTAEALESLTTNDLVDVIAETTGDDGMKWYKITTESGVTGYVRSDLIKKATVTVDVTQTENKTAYIAGSNANIRQDASTSSGFLGFVKIFGTEYHNLSVGVSVSADKPCFYIAVDGESGKKNILLPFVHKTGGGE